MNGFITVDKLRIVLLLALVFLLYEVSVPNAVHEERSRDSLNGQVDELLSAVYDEINSTESGTAKSFYSSFGELPNNSISTIMEAYQTSRFGVDHQINNLKRILFWNEAYGSKDYGIGFGQQGFVQMNCPVSNCFTTDDRTLVPVQDFDAIVFHLRSFDPEDLPERRDPKQRYIFWSMESPQYSLRDIYPLNGFFNWTFTYKTDSDIVQPYGWVEPKSKSNPLNSGNTNYAHGKTKMAAWFVSNCESQSQRETYVQSLQKHISVDVYGGCGPLRCERENLQACYRMLETDYKFYLSFENSFCDDYVTEKLFSILELNVIPIVFGGANYSRIAPPRSYINALDFATAEDLAEYLKLLSSNDNLYNQYFEWKQHYRVRNDASDLKLSMCGLCARLHRDSREKTYDDMEKWWTRQSHCKKPRKNNVFRIPYWDN